MANSGARGARQQPQQQHHTQQARRPNILRELSEQEVFEAIFAGGPITRPQIAARTKLSKATVGAVVDRLEEEGLIRVSGPQHGRRGRSPLTYEIPDTAGFVVGVDIGGSNIRAAAADIHGELIADEQHRTSRHTARAVSAQALEIVGRLVDRARTSHERLTAIGISTPGVVDQVSRRVTSLAYNISPDGGLDPIAAIQSRFDVPVLIENNVNLAALGESWKGLARGVSTFAYIAIGAGVGMGLVVNNELVRGAHGAAGEIGYLPSSSDPYDERHRLHGGLEDEIGAAGVLGAYRARRRDDEQNAPADQQDTPADEQHAPADEQHAPADAHDVFELAAHGDADAAAVVETVARRLGIAIASIAAVVDPELVVLGGGIGSNPALLQPVRSTVAQLLPVSARIETSTLGDRAALHGSVAIALRDARAQLFTRAAR